MKYITLVAIFFSFYSGFSQIDTVRAFSKSEKRVGEFYFFWGWNRGYYSKSDIQFEGDNYNFTLYNVVAKDRQTPFGFDPYFHPLKITLPQTNMRLGYYLKDNLQISLGVDHMKYVMQQDQDVLINGTIRAGSKYDAYYSDSTIKIIDDFLSFEHTDGLNYINTELRRESLLLNYSVKNFPFGVFLHYGGGVGVLFPKTNTKLLNKRRYDEFHVAGFGLDIVSGLQLTAGKHFFFQSEAKIGYINMPDIRTTQYKSDKASQHFNFFQWNILFGWRFRLYN